MNGQGYSRPPLFEERNPLGAIHSRSNPPVQSHFTGVLGDSSVADVQNVYFSFSGSSLEGYFPPSINTTSGAISTRDAVSSSSFQKGLRERRFGYRVHSTEEEPFSVYISWGHWQYYSTQLWNVSSIYNMYVSLREPPMSQSMAESTFAKVSTGAVGNRRELLLIYSVGM